MQPKQLIKDVTFDFEKKDGKCGPHIAYTLPSQGGAASKLNRSFLFKAEEVNEQIAMEAEQIIKAASMNKKKELLRNALCEAYCDSDEWLCVEDWTDTDVVFSMGDWDSCELLTTSYTESNDTFTVGDTAQPVVRVCDFITVDGKLKLSEEAESKLESGMYSIVTKAIESTDLQEKLIKQLAKVVEKADEQSVTAEVHDETTTTIEMEKSVEQEDIMKSAEVQAFIAAAIEKATATQNTRIAELEKAREELIQKQEEADKAQMLDVFKGYSFVSEEEAIALTDALFKQEAAVSVMNVLEKAKEALSVLATEEHGVEAEVELKTDLDKSKATVAEILKSRKSKK